PTANITVGTTTGYTQITAPTAPYANFAVNGWYVMNRFWNLTPSVANTSPIPMRSYFAQADYNSMQTAVPSLSSPSQLYFFKFTSGSGVDPNPANGHAGADFSEFLPLASTVNNWGSNYYAEFTVNSFSGGGGGSNGNGSGFPVEWLDFTASPTSAGTVALTWSVAAEKNLSHYEVERSLDGTSFQKMEEIPYLYTPNTTNTYATQDKQPFQGAAYYRIRQLDLDGRFSYSNTEKVWVEPNLIRVNIAPNPNQGVFDLLANANLSQVEVQIWSIDGRKIATYYFPTLNGKATLDIRKEVAKGVYLFKILAEESITGRAAATYHKVIVE
ncbi:MAG: T9SS type A sorting domain-containing protein, partial [Bacteroidia bacterium]